PTTLVTSLSLSLSLASKRIRPWEIFLGVLASLLSLFLSAKRSQKMTGEAAEAGEISSVSLDLLKTKMAEFARERDWDRFHSPRNLLLALVGEVGELSEIFQWKGEVPKGLPDWKEEERVHLGEELSDVLLYLVRLSDICGIDLGKAALRKLQLNAIKYPAAAAAATTNHYSSTNNGATKTEKEQQKAAVPN
ncbi:unnamed protein product, partial [Linum tenue]